MRDERNRIAIERTDALETERKEEVPRIVRVVHRAHSKPWKSRCSALMLTLKEPRCQIQKRIIVTSATSYIAQCPRGHTPLSLSSDASNQQSSILTV